MNPSPTDRRQECLLLQEEITRLDLQISCFSPNSFSLGSLQESHVLSSTPCTKECGSRRRTCTQEDAHGGVRRYEKRRPRHRNYHRSLLLVATAVAACVQPTTSTASPPPGTIPCDGDDDSTCLTFVGQGSECVDGLCSNPFVSGCLRSFLGQNTQKPNGTRSSPPIDDQTRTLRVCNSQDSQETIANGICLPNPLDYMEIRILTGNWESSLLTAWALQILLSEWLQVPTSIESSSPDREANFYHPTNRFEYGATAYDYEALEVAHRVGDCTRPLGSTQIIGDNLVELQGEMATGEADEEEGQYRSCSHVMPEVWNGQADNLWRLTQRRIIEAPEGNGVVGKLTWYIPKSLAEQRPELAHYSGWTQNRTSIASEFLRPLKWKEYCQLVSPSQCDEPDEHAARPPSESEGGMYYDTPGSGEGYKGYFYDGDAYRNCTANPTNCTGDFVDFPCDWSSFAVPQIHHMGIPLASQGSQSVNKAYSYGEKLQIWEAANATGRAVVMNWYTPDPTYQWYRGTEAEFHEVQLPPPSPECVGARVSTEDRCSDDPAVRVGAKAGACGAEVQTLEKVVVNNLYHTIYNVPRAHQQSGFRGGNKAMEKVDERETDATRSPAYEAVKNFHLSEFDIGRMFEDWRDRLRQRGHDDFSTWSGTTGADPRHAVCQWVADNAEHLQTFVPFTYPRILVEDDEFKDMNMTISYVALGFAVFVTACILCMGAVTYALRDKEAFKTAQLPFLYLVLLGLLLISIGGIVHALAPENGTCIARIWLINMGYTLAITPLIVKIAAISRMLQAAKKMKRIRISRHTLFGVVGGICLLTASYLTAWTVLDAPTKGRQLTLQLEDMDYQANQEGGTSWAWWQVPATPISVSYYCRSSGSAAWFSFSVVWQCLLLLSAAVLALQTRRLQERWNESRSLAIMVYTQGGFVGLRFLMWLFEEPSGVSVQLLDVLRSFAFSLDAFLALMIYFGSKLVNVYQGSSGAVGSTETFTGDSAYGGAHFAGPGPYGRASLENCKTVSEYFKAVGEPPSLFGQGLSSRQLDTASPLDSGGLVGTSSRAGDIMVSQASSRRLAIAPLKDELKEDFCDLIVPSRGASRRRMAIVPAIKDDSETMPLCSRCREAGDESTPPRRSLRPSPPRSFRSSSNHDSNISGAAQTKALLAPLSENSELSQTVGTEVEPEEEASTLVAHEEDSDTRS